MMLVQRRRRALGRLVAIAVVLVVVGGPSSAAGALANDVGDVSYVPPVEGPVVDGFRPPETPYGPGNRGLKYGARPGDPVRASADGAVTFAGQVGGTLHVTVRHADGVRTSYSFLASVGVGRGQRVRQGDPVGTAGEVLHFGARLGDAYIDPASLFGDRGGQVELIPFEVAPGATADEVEPLREIVLSDGSPGPGPGPVDDGANGVGRGDDARPRGRSDVATWLRGTSGTTLDETRRSSLGGRLLGADRMLDLAEEVAALWQAVATRGVFAVVP